MPYLARVSKTYEFGDLAVAKSGTSAKWQISLAKFLNQHQVEVLQIKNIEGAVSLDWKASMEKNNNKQLLFTITERKKLFVILNAYRLNFVFNFTLRLREQSEGHDFFLFKVLLQIQSK